MAIEEGKYLSDLLKWELDKNYCREIVTITSGHDLKCGAVVGLISASGLAKPVSLDPEEEDGSDVAVGVLLKDTDASGAPVKTVMIARVAIIASDAVIFPAGTTDAQKKKIIKDLKNVGILIRKAI
jgi:hypothetical protein